MFQVVNANGERKTVSLADLSNPSGVLSPEHGGTGLDALGTAGQLLQVNGDGDGLEYTSDVSLGNGTFSGSLSVAGNAAFGTDTLFGGSLFVGDTSNANMTRGLTINQGAADNEILAFKSSDVDHGMTTLAETDTYGAFQKRAAIGGLRVIGFTSGTGALDFTGRHTTDDTAKSTSANGAIRLVGQLKNGTTVAGLGANANILVIYNSGNARWLVDAEGDTHYDGTTNAGAWDDYNDIELLTAVRALTAQGDFFKERFSHLVKEYAPVLAQTGVITLNEDGRHFVSTKGLNGLFMDAFRQMHERITILEGRLRLLEGT